MIWKKLPFVVLLACAPAGLRAQTADPSLALGQPASSRVQIQPTLRFQAEHTDHVLNTAAAERDWLGRIAGTLALNWVPSQRTRVAVNGGLDTEGYKDHDELNTLPVRQQVGLTIARALSRQTNVSFGFGYQQTEIPGEIVDPGGLDIGRGTGRGWSGLAMLTRIVGPRDRVGAHYMYRVIELPGSPIDRAHVAQLRWGHAATRELGFTMEAGAAWIADRFVPEAALKVQRSFRRADFSLSAARSHSPFPEEDQSVDTNSVSANLSVPMSRKLTLSLGPGYFTTSGGSGGRSQSLRGAATLALRLGSGANLSATYRYSHERQGARAGAQGAASFGHSVYTVGLSVAPPIRLN
jgi:hypothetical protein